MATQSSDIMSVISFVTFIACLCTTDAVLRRNFEENEQWNGSELKDSQKTVGKTILHDEIQGRLTVLAPDQITNWSQRYISRKRPRSLTQNTTHVCGPRTITMKASWFDWKGLFVRLHPGKVTDKRVVKSTMIPYPTFNLTICDGSCRGTGIENVGFFKDFHTELLARLTQKEADKLQLGHKPCCVPSKYGEEEVPIVLNFVAKASNHVHLGKVIGLKNAVACECR